MLSTQDRILIEQRVANAKPSMGAAYLLAIFFGMVGGHRFYLGRIGSAVAMLLISLTVVGLIVTSIWSLVDLFLIPGIIREKVEQLRSEYTSDAMAMA